VAGRAPASAALEGLLDRVAASRATALLSGESGSGKSHAARELHRRGPDPDAPLVQVDVSSLSPTLLEAELFGHAEGAYTGADRARRGRFERADGGTLVLDGIENLPLEHQVKLLRVLQERVVEPLGGEPVPVDVRVVATTGADLRERVEDGRFREDLYYRLAVVTLEVPPLRSRLEDLEPLVEHLAAAAAVRVRVPVRRFGPEALARLASHAWPGNLRELENAIERVLVLGAAGDEEVAPEELAFLDGQGEGEAARLARQALAAGVELEELEAAMIEAAVEEQRGNLSAAARRVGLSRRALEYRLNKAREARGEEPS
jgi:DNA-binding NtrC family response regulator